MMTRSLRVLLVSGLHGSTVLKRRLQRYASLQAYEISCTRGLEEAQNQLQNTEYDIVLLDLPLSGRKARKAVQALHLIQKIPVICLTRRGGLAQGTGLSVVGRKDLGAISRTIARAIAGVSLNRTSELMAECRKLVVRATSEEMLLSSVCHILVAKGGYSSAWVGFCCDDESCIVCAASCDPGEACVRAIEMDQAAGSEARVFYAARGESCCLRPSGCSCRSTIVLPMKAGGRAFGALVICDSSDTAFEHSRIRLLRELAGDLAFRINALRTRCELNVALQDLRQRTAQLRTLASELTNAEERERKRLAQAIHDDLQQLLVGARFCADSLLNGVKDPKLRESALQLNEILNKAIESSRSLTFELSPPVLHDAGLARALHYLARRMESVHGLSVTVNADEQAEPEAEDLRVLLFQATRELLFNVVKHARAETAKVTMRKGKGNLVEIVVTDEGVGFDPGKADTEDSQNGFGLFSIKGRLGLVGGRLEVSSTPGHGTNCTIVAPLGRISDPELGWEGGVSHAKPTGGLMRAGPRHGNPGLSSDCTGESDSVSKS
ncbi:MAG: hypothetical protein GXX84_15040 [Acidobacteria bacterium]|nr:hypothetical protein [Acidobacteriota bacterium]